MRHYRLFATFCIIAISLGGVAFDVQAITLVQDQTVTVTAEVRSAVSSEPVPLTNNWGTAGGGGNNGSTPNVPENPDIPVPPASITINGTAYPKATVALLENGKRVTRTIADDQGLFSLQITNASLGNHIFSVVARDSSFVRSPLYSFPLQVTASAAISIDHVTLGPTLSTSTNPIGGQKTISAWGFGIPNSKVWIILDGNTDPSRVIDTALDGSYSFSMDTSPLDLGDHVLQSMSQVGSVTSPMSIKKLFSTTGIVPPKPVSNLIGDINHDGKVDLSDMSILAFWYGKPTPPSEVDMNADGTITLADFSILTYYWTGQ